MTNLADLNLAYSQQANAYRQQNAAELARNAYGRFLAQQRGARKQFNLREETERQAPRLVSGYSRRGLTGPNVQSGVYQKALTDFARKNFQQASDIQEEINRDINESMLEESSMRELLNRQLADLETEKQRQISAAAASLTALRPLIGG